MFFEIVTVGKYIGTSRTLIFMIAFVKMSLKTIQNVSLFYFDDGKHLRNET